MKPSTVFYFLVLLVSVAISYFAGAQDARKIDQEKFEKAYLEYKESLPTDLWADGANQMRIYLSQFEECAKHTKNVQIKKMDNFTPMRVNERKFESEKK